VTQSLIMTNYTSSKAKALLVSLLTSSCFFIIPSWSFTLTSRPSSLLSTRIRTRVNNPTATRSTSSVVLFGSVLSKASILKYASSKKNKKNGINKTNRVQQHNQKRKSTYLTKTFLLEVLEEALYRQTLAIDALDRETDRKEQEIITEENDISEEQKEMIHEKQSQTMERIKKRKLYLESLITKLKTIQTQTKHLHNPSQTNLQTIQKSIIQLGFQSLLNLPVESYKTKQRRNSEFGRPDGFDGKIYYSPLGVPILIGRLGTHKDDILRKAAQGSDLFFQVEDYNGSRVLLRTSLMRGTKNSKKCIQMAANLAAKYSVWGMDSDFKYSSIPVMYTDARKVAKRGPKVGHMKQKKSLGRLYGVPHDV
jgi:predicted ribosome quality control (RQC) complex YloA/Tae2 family protein